MKLRREAKVGIFAVLTLAALYWGINFLKGKDIFNGTSTYYATYDQVNGLQKSAAIMIRGFNIGVVSNLTFDPSKSDKIVIELSVKKEYKIPVDSKARIYSDGLLGGKAIELVLGESDQYLHKGDTIRMEADKDFLEVAGSELEFVKQKVSGLTNDVSETLGNLNKIMVDNTQSIATTLGNLAEISSSIKTVVKTEQGDIQSIIANINRISATLRDNAGRIDGIIANVNEFSDSLRASDVAGTINNLSASLSQLNRSLTTVNNNEGTLGKLVNDEKLYDSLVSATSNLSLLLEDLRENPGRYVHISVFGKNKNKTK